MSHYNPANDPAVVNGIQEAYGFKIGDLVEYTNDNGVRFRPRKVVGFVQNPTPDFLPDNTVYINTDAPWFAVKPSSLKKIERKDAFMKTYKVQMYISGSEEDAIALRKELAQIVHDEFQLGPVFGVTVDLDDPPADIHDRVMALCMVGLEDGLDARQISKLMDALPTDKKYMQIEFHENNTSAYGFIDAEYYGTHNYEPGFISEQIQAILDDVELEKPDGRYMTPDGRQFYMGYFND